MPIRIETTYEGMAPYATRKEVDALKKSAFLEIATRWKQRFSHKHFLPSGARQYKYRARATKNIFSGKVNPGFRGKAVAPSGFPLTWSGRTRRIAEESTTYKATPSWSAASAPLRALRFKHRGRPLREEYRRVLRREEQTLARDAEKNITKSFRKNKRKFKIRAFK